MFLESSVSYDAHSVTGQLTRKNTAAAAQAMGIDSASAQQSALADANSALAAINSLSGQAHASGNAVLFNALDYQTRLLNNRIDDASEQGRFGFWLESGQLCGSLDQNVLIVTIVARYGR